VTCGRYISTLKHSRILLVAIYDMVGDLVGDVEMVGPIPEHQTVNFNFVYKIQG